MSFHLIDFSTKFDWNFDNFIIGKKIKKDQDNGKYYIYYQPDPNETPKEIYLKLPKLRLIYNIGNYKYNQLSIPIYPNWEQTDIFINWIKTLEKNIEDCFLNKKIKKELTSIITKKNLLNFIKAKVSEISEQIKISSDIQTQSNLIKLSDFKLNGQIEMVIKLSYIWSRSDKIGLSSELYQIKYYAPPNQLEIDFIDPIVKQPTIQQNLINQLNQINKSIPPPPPPPLLPLPNIIPNKEIQLPPQIKVIPSVKDLQNAIKGLKRIINKDD